jgi:cytochrome c oxidase cbb3-type subunit 3
MFTYKSNYLQTFSRKLLFLLPMLIAGSIASAQQTSGAPAPSIWDNPLALTMLAIILVLLLVIALLANVVLGTAQLHSDKQKKKNNTAQIVTAIALFLLPMLGSAQETTETTAAGSTSIGGLSATTFWLLSTVIAVEFLVIIVMGFFVKSFLAKEKLAVTIAEETTVAKPSSFKVWWDKLNSFKPMEQEANIDLGHNYDGIRELDNRLPPWWLYGFYVTIIIGGIYLWRYHIAETAPLSKQEFEIAMKHAEEEKAAYLAKAANNIDENSVTLITDKAALEAGKNTFVQMCAACHGKAGEGIVGPNLTDDYWLNGGDIKDVFKTIKYGRPEKGMKSWQEDFSPVQISQLASFIKSLKGTNPPNAKEKQGDLYQQNAAPAKDSATGKKDVASN